jgi:hypothetical protein
VGVVEHGEDFGLTLEAAQSIGVGRHRGWKHFQGHLAFQIRVGGAVDLAMPPRRAVR